MSNLLKIILLLINLQAFTFASFAAAAPNAPGLNVKLDRSKPLSITSDKLNADQAASQAVFTGNVIVIQDTFKLRSDLLRVTYAGDGLSNKSMNDSSALKRIEAEGNVVVTSDDASAKGDKADYRPNENKLIMQGNIVLTQQGRIITGDLLTADTLNNTATVTGKTGGRRVQVLLPGESPAEAKDASGGGKSRK